VRVVLGHAGYNEYWLNETNACSTATSNVAGERMVELSHRFPRAEGLASRALKQAARELMLAQSSDWAFIMRTGTTRPLCPSAAPTLIFSSSPAFTDDLLRGRRQRAVALRHRGKR